MNLFGPNFGAASAHIEQLTKEREDFVLASKAQASRISALEKELASLKEDLQVANEQLAVQGLISESRARQLQEEREAAERADAKMERMRSAVCVSAANLRATAASPQHG